MTPTLAALTSLALPAGLALVGLLTGLGIPASRQWITGRRSRPGPSRERSVTRRRP